MRPEAEQIAAKYNETQLDKVVRGEVAPPTARSPKLPRHMKEAATPLVHFTLYNSIGKHFTKFFKQM